MNKRGGSEEVPGRVITKTSVVAGLDQQDNWNNRDDHGSVHNTHHRGREELERLVAARMDELAKALESCVPRQRNEVRRKRPCDRARRWKPSVGLRAAPPMTSTTFCRASPGASKPRVGVSERGALPRRNAFSMRQRPQSTAPVALTHLLLAFARRQCLDPRPIDPDGLVAGMPEMICRTMGPGIRVELNLRDGAWGGLCDGNELESALLSLLGGCELQAPQKCLRLIKVYAINFIP
jgi:hypothetical protein